MYKVKEHIKYTFTNDETNSALIIPKENDVPNMKKSLCLSGVSLMIWDLLTTDKHDEEIYKHLSAIYEVDPIELKKDCDEFIDELIAKGYIVKGV